MPFILLDISLRNSGLGWVRVDGGEGEKKKCTDQR